MRNLFAVKQCEFCDEDYVVTWEKADKSRFCSRRCYGFARTREAKRAYAQRDEREVERLDERIRRWQIANDELRLRLTLLSEIDARRSEFSLE